MLTIDICRKHDNCSSCHGIRWKLCYIRTKLNRSVCIDQRAQCTLFSSMEHCFTIEKFGATIESIIEFKYKIVIRLVLGRIAKWTHKQHVTAGKQNSRENVSNCWTSEPSKFGEHRALECCQFDRPPIFRQSVNQV